MADPMNTGPGSLIITPTSTFDTLPKNEVSAPSLNTYNIYIRVVNVAEVPGKFEYALEVLGHDHGLQLANYSDDKEFIFTVDNRTFNFGRQMDGQAIGVFECNDPDLSGSSEETDFTVVVVYVTKDPSQAPEEVSAQIQLTPVLEGSVRPDKKILVWFAFDDPETGGGGQGDYGGSGGDGGAPPPPGGGGFIRLTPNSFGDS